MELSEGDFFYIRENDLFLLFKVLQTGEPLLVRSYWPETELPSADNRRTFSVERACTEFQKDIQLALKTDREPVTETDRQEIEKFNEIRAGLASRQTRLLEILSAADEYMSSENWLEAMHLFTEAASFARNNPEIFEKRAKCYEKLGMRSEANADQNHARELRKFGC